MATCGRRCSSTPSNSREPAGRTPWCCATCSGWPGQQLRGVPALRGSQRAAVPRSRTMRVARIADAMAARLNSGAQPGPRASGRSVVCGRPVRDTSISHWLNQACSERRSRRTSESVRDAHTRPPDDGGDTLKAHHPFQILIGCIDDLVATGVLSADRRDGLDEAALGRCARSVDIVPRRSAQRGRRRPQAADRRPVARRHRRRPALNPLNVDSTNIVCDAHNVIAVNIEGGSARDHRHRKSSDPTARTQRPMDRDLCSS